MNNEGYTLIAAAVLLLVLATVLSAGCVNTSNQNASASPSAQQGSNAAGAAPIASSGIPTSVNGHEYTYYHNMNNRSTCGLCHSNMR